MPTSTKRWNVIAVAATLAVVAALFAASRPARADLPVGVPASAVLTKSGTVKAKRDGQVIENLDVTGMIYVYGDNVTIRNTRVTQSSWYAIRVMDGATGLVVEDSTIRCTGARTSGIVFTDYTARRVEANGCATPFANLDRANVAVHASRADGKVIDNRRGSTSPTTVPPTTAPPTTVAPATPPPTTAPPTTVAPATPPPTTVPPTTVPPTTVPPTTAPPAAPTGSHPTFASTGPRAGVALTPSGSLTISTDGAVVENREVRGGIVVNANNVTIRNVRILGTTANGITLNRGYRGLTMDRIEIIGQFSNGQKVAADNGIYGEGSWTLRNSRISGYPDGAKLHSNQTVEGNYFFGNSRTIDLAGRAKHTDGLQSMGGSNVVIRNNTFVSDFRGDFSMGSNLMIQNEFAKISNYLVEGNRFSGGNYTVYFTDKGSGHGPHQNVVVRNNTFTRNTWQYGPVYLRGSGMDVRFSGNAFQDGAPFNP